MNSKQRVHACLNYQKPDRPPMASLWMQDEVVNCIKNNLNLSSYEEIQNYLGEDFRKINPTYTGKIKTYKDGSYDGMWGERYARIPYKGGTYEESVFQPFKKITSLEEAKTLSIPTPDDFDLSHVNSLCKKHDDYALITGHSGYLDFMNAIACYRGVEQVYMDVALESDVYLYLVEKRFELHMELTKRTLIEADGAIDIVYCGEDLGTQIGPLINPIQFKKLFASKYRALFDLAHSYGAKAMMHSCGSIQPFIPIFLDIGLNILEGVQVDAAKMDIKDLHHQYYKKLAFCGSISVQSVLPRGRIQDVTNEVELRKELFKDGGIIIGPTNCLQTDMPLENLYAMCRAIGTIK